MTLGNIQCPHCGSPRGAAIVHQPAPTDEPIATRFEEQLAAGNILHEPEGDPEEQWECAQCGHRFSSHEGHAAYDAAHAT